MKRIDFSSIRVRLLLLIILASIPAMLFIANNALEERSAATARIQAETMQLTKLSASSQEEWLEGAHQLLATLAHHPAVRNRDPGACSRYFADIHKSYSRYANIFAVAPDGDVFCSAIPMKQAVSSADREYFKRAVSSGNFSIGDYQPAGRVTGIPVIVAAYPVYDGEGNLQAVVAASLDLRWLNKLAETMQLPPNSTFIVIDRKGTVLARYPEPEKWGGQSMPEAGIVKMILSQDKGTAEASGLDGVNRLFASAPVRSKGVETGIFVGVGIPVSISYAHINDRFVRNFTWLGITILFMLAITWFGSDFYVMRNVNAMMSATKRFGAGEFGVRTGVPYNRGEVGELTRAFDWMAGSLQEKEVERKKAEETLRESEERNRLLIELSPYGIAIHCEGKMIFVNSKAAQILGARSPEELVGKPVLSIIHPDYHDVVRERILMEEAGKIAPLIEEKFLRMDGSPVDVEIVAIPVKIQGKIYKYGVFSDITERKRAVELRIEKEALEYASKAKSDFLASMSHELRTPLNAILGFSELLGNGIAGELNEKQKRYIDNINNSGNFLLTLINDILDLSKVEAGKIELNIENLSIPVTIDETLTLIKEKAMKHNININKEIDPELIFIEADKQRVKQILFNLLSNAVKFSKEEGGTVTVSAKKNGELAEISVSDTGIGIKPENMNKLFKKFEQLDKEISAKYGGTGLGLSICKQLSELHGGKIWAQSKYGEGSIFTFTLPLKACAEAVNS